ncbi:MAG: LamG-like jellyroll fold domain-containing protein [Candidatus Omnitrophota bacterium]
MMKKSRNNWLLGLIIYSSFVGLHNVFAGEFKPDKNTLFLVHFNKGLNADYARGSKETAMTASLTEKNGGCWEEGLLVKDGLTITPEEMEVLYRPLGYKAKNSFNSQRGTMELWVKVLNFPKDLSKENELGLISISDWRTLPGPEWALEGCTAYGYLAIIYSNKVKKITFTEFRKEVKYDLTNIGTLDEDRFRIDADVKKWKTGEWHHIAAAWDAENDRRTLFVDGKRVGEAKFKYPDRLLVPNATDIVVGGIFKKSLTPFSCMIDEVRISDVVRYTGNFIPEKREGK